MNHFIGYAVWSVLPLAVSLTTACGGKSPSAGTAPERVYRVETAAAETAEIRVTVEAIGTALASEKAELRPQADGIVAEILFDEASHVESGALLVRLDDRKAAARLALAKAGLDSARARRELTQQRFRRQQELLAEELVSRQDFDSAEAEDLAAAATVREQEASVALAARELEDYYIRAPFAGIVGERLVDVGNYVQRGSLIAVLMKMRPMEVEFRVADRYASVLRKGITAMIMVAGYDEPVRATVTFIDPRVDPNTRMLTLRASTDNADNVLRPGQFVEVSALLEVRPRQVVIPEEAVLSVAGDTWAYVVEDGIARRRELRLGERRPPRVEVLAGIDAGDTLVVGGQHRLSDGSRVVVPGVADSDGA